MASIFIFALQGGIGCERLSQFFRLLRLDKHIGVSPTALRTIRSKIESTIIQYQKVAQKSIQKKASGVEVCLAADETFFDQVILVMLDLPSGYILVEEIAENCQYSTWQQQLKSNLKGLNLKIKYLVSDRAKAIVKFALKDLGTNSIADLFHILYNLNRSIGFEINCLITRYNKQIESAEKDRTKWGTVAQLKNQQEIIEQSRLIFENCCYQITTCLHPIDINHNSILSTEIVSVELNKILNKLQIIRTNHKLRDTFNGIKNLKNQIESLSAVIDIWWSWVDQCLAQFEPNIIQWVKEFLIPAVYWQQQVKRTKNSGLRKDYQAAQYKANQLLERHPITISLSITERQKWWDWAIWIVSKFQRSSSAVEGRNGYLSQVFAQRRGISCQRLKVATVIHNFYIQRSDGTTAAERLFGQKFPDLFEYLFEHIAELPQPRRARKLSRLETFTLPTVPA